MVTSIKANVPAVTLSTISEDKALRVALNAAEVASQGAMKFAAAGAAYFIITCHLQPEDKRKTLTDAREELGKHIADNKGVGNEMLKRYLQVCGKAYSVFTDKGTKFPLVVQKLAKETDAQAAADYVERVFTHDWGCQSLNKLRNKLGINTGSRGSELTPKKPHEKVTTAITNIAAGMKEDMTPKQREKEIPLFAKAVVQASPAEALIAVIRESLSKLAELDSVRPQDVAMIAKLAADAARSIEARAKVRKQTGKATTETVVAAKARGNGKARNARVTAH